MRIILASASPRRRELLHQIGWNFEVCVSQVEEVITKTLPAEVVEELSLQKAKAVFDSVLISEPATTDEGILVIGADTVVACDGNILGKPKDKEDAVRMLGMLQGRAHHVYTGVTLCCRFKDGRELIKSFHEETEVTFYPMTEAEMQGYVKTKDPMDKAGAYGIQGVCACFISGIKGDYNNVVGLPVGRLYQEVRNLIKE